MISSVYIFFNWPSYNLCFSRMVVQMGTKTKMVKSPSDDHGLSLSSSHHLNRVYSSLHLFTPASHPTRATYVHLYASQRTLSACRPIRLPLSSALSGKARACTSLRSYPRLLLQPVAKACSLRQRQNLPHVVCCGPVSHYIKSTKLYQLPVPLTWTFDVNFVLFPLHRQLWHHTTHPVCDRWGYSSQPRAVSISLPSSSKASSSIMETVAFLCYFHKNDTVPLTRALSEPQ